MKPEEESAKAMRAEWERVGNATGRVDRWDQAWVAAYRLAVSRVQESYERQLSDEYDKREALDAEIAEARSTVEAWRPVVRAAIAWNEMKLEDEVDESGFPQCDALAVAVDALPADQRPK